MQHLADVLVDSAVRDSPELVIQDNGSTGSSQSNGDLLQSPASLNPGNPDSAQTAPTSKCIRIEDRPYFLCFGDWSRPWSCGGLHKAGCQPVDAQHGGDGPSNRILEGIQFTNVSGCPWGRCNAVSWSEEHYSKASRSVWLYLGARHCLNYTQSSFGIAVTLHNGGPYPLHTGNFPATPQPKSGSNAG